MSASDYLYLSPLLIIAGAPIVIMLTLSIFRNYQVVFGFSIFALVSAFVSSFNDKSFTTSSFRCFIPF